MVFLWAELLDKGGRALSRSHPLPSWEAAWPDDLRPYLEAKCRLLNDKPDIDTADTRLRYYVGRLDGSEP
jgi:hypothetical protein